MRSLCRPHPEKICLERILGVVITISQTHGWENGLVEVNNYDNNVIKRLKTGKLKLCSFKVNTIYFSMPRVLSISGSTDFVL